MNTTTSVAESFLKERPKHIVLFEEPSEENTELLCKVLDVQEHKNAGARANRDVLTAKNGVHSRVYRRLGIAVTSLTKNEKETLESSKKVIKVFENRIRRLPPYYSDPRGHEDEQPQSADMLGSYLAGIRDTVELIQRFSSGEKQRAGLRTEAFSSISQTGSAAQKMSWCLSLIGMSPNYTKATGKNTIVAVLDTGIDLTHPDFSNQHFIDNVNVKTFVPNEGVQDENGHGTHCAGVIAGKKNPSVGRRYSVAPDAALLIGKVLNNDGEGSDDWILDGMDWAQEQGAQIISMSLGSLRAKDEAFDELYERTAKRLLDEGVLVVAAAGNESNRPFSRIPVGNPAACPSIMSVGAIDRQKKVAYFSCAELDTIGGLDICAPGVAVLSSWKDNGYQSISGTSMAAPHVAGIAALYLETDPNISAKDLWELLETSAVQIVDKSDYGNGLAQVP